MLVFLFRAVLLLSTTACFAHQAQAREFVFAGRTVSCTVAGKYRDTNLFPAYASALDNFDATREQRINAAIKEFEADVAKLAKDIEKADEVLTKRLAIAATGVVFGATAKKLSTVGVKTPLSEQEKKALEALADRGSEWTNIFMKYGTLGEVDVTAIVAMPASFLLALTPFGTAQRVWALGNTTIDIVSAIAEAEITKGEKRLQASTIVARTKALAGKLQLPKIRELDILRAEIDKQCG